MAKLLQIDSCLNMLSTGRITEGIGELVTGYGWEAYIVHGARYKRSGTCMSPIQSDTKCEEYEHFFESLLFDNHGLASRRATRKVLDVIQMIEPDVIHLHCLHGYYINYKLLFDYLNSTRIPIVWTFHDCWAFTGHCAHFVSAECDKWQKKGCHTCPLVRSYPKSLLDRSQRNFFLKKELFSANNNLHIVAVSDWLASITRQSFLGDKDIRVINNGVSIDKFKPLSKKSNSIFCILGVASAWSDGKGLSDFYRIREKLPEEEFSIILVGLTLKQISSLPYGIKGVSKTDSIEELAKLYSEANVLVNPTYADSFPTVNMEALACGTPVITYRTGGSPDIIDRKTGVVVEQGDIDGLVHVIRDMREHPLAAQDCRNRAVEKYDKNKRFLDYLTLYESIIN